MMVTPMSRVGLPSQLTLSVKTLEDAPRGMSSGWFQPQQVGSDREHSRSLWEAVSRTCTENAHCSPPRLSKCVSVLQSD